MDLEHRPEFITRPNGAVVRPNPKKDREWRRRRPRVHPARANARAVKDHKGNVRMVGWMRMRGCSLRAATNKQATKPGYIKP